MILRSERMLRDMISRNAVTEYDGELFCEIADEHLCCEKALVKDEAIAKLREALERISTTPYRIYDGNRPFISDHDSGYAQGIAAGHQLAAMWAEKALAETEQVEDGWRQISTAPKDTYFDSFGEFRPVNSDRIFMIRRTDDYFGSNTPYPLTDTTYRHEDMFGKYTRTHWMPLPPLPKETK